MISQGRGKTTILSLLLIVLLSYAAWVLFFPSPVKSNIAYVEGHLVTAYSAVDARITRVSISPGQRVEPNSTAVTLDLRDWHAKNDLLTLKAKTLKDEIASLQALASHLAQISAAKKARHTHYAQSLKLLEDSQRRQNELGDYISAHEKDSIAMRVAEQQALLLESLQEHAQAQLFEQENQAKQQNLHNQLAELETEKRWHQDKQSDHRIVLPEASYIHNIFAFTQEHIQRGQPLFEYVPMESMWITVYFKETELGALHQHQPVSVVFDAYPDLSFTGKIISISSLAGAALSPQTPNYSAGNFTRIVQRIPVKVKLDDEGVQPPHLALGLSATVTVTP